jgi:hypothetical protein
MGGEVVSTFKRLRLFVRDYIEEFPVAWSLARTRDCERNGGHRWTEPHVDPVLGYGKTCKRCGCGEMVYRSTAVINPAQTTTANTGYTIQVRSGS